MDFMKILLGYMATTFVLSVSSTATPGPTPVPTPTPVPAYEEIVPVTPAPTDTPVPTVSVTPEPVPTITPSSAYRQLQQGDRGDNVRKLQERLIELGYLQEGSADGAYGGQTRMAVRRFQYYNSLQVDGIAGKATQTNLFENPDARPYPAATPEPEEESDEVTPAPDEESDEVTPVPDEETDEVTPVPDEGSDEVAPVPEEETDEVIPVPDGKSDEATPVPEGETAAPAETTVSPDEAVTGGTDGPATILLTEGETTEPAESTEAPAEETAEVAAETAAPAEAAESGQPAGPAETPAAEVEEVSLDESEYMDLPGWIVLNDAGEHMQWIEMEDGVPVMKYPRMQVDSEGNIRVSLADLGRAVDAWSFSVDEGTAVLVADGYILAVMNGESGPVVMVDGTEMVLNPGDADPGSPELWVSADLLARALDGECEWDAEEGTLMIRIPGKEAAHPTD